MGIFGKETKEIEARAMYYEGGTPDFILDHAPQKAYGLLRDFH